MSNTYESAIELTGNKAACIKWANNVVRQLKGIGRVECVELSGDHRIELVTNGMPYMLAPIVVPSDVSIDISYRDTDLGIDYDMAGMSPASGWYDEELDPPLAPDSIGALMMRLRLKS